VSAKQIYYLDSDHVIAYIHDVPRNKDLGSAFRDFISRRGTKKGINFVLPQVAVGEVINYIVNENKVDKTKRKDLMVALVELIQDLNIDLKPATRESLEIARWLLGKENFTDTTDAIILSQALCDPNSKYLLTSDSVLTGSELIMSICKGEKRDKKSKEFVEQFIDRKNSKLRIQPVTNL